MNLTDPDDRSAAAGEYVLGTLSVDDRPAFEQALAGDAALQAEVYAWQDRLLGLANAVAPVEPSAGSWAAIEARLPKGPAAAAAAAALSGPGAPDTTTSAATSAARPAAAPAAPGLQGADGRADRPAANDALWRRLRRWQLTSGLAVAASLLLATLLVVRAPGPAPDRYLAVLESPDRASRWLVEVTAGRTVRLVPIGAQAAVPPGKSVQFWTKPEGATGPTSLGLVRLDAPTELPVARLPAVGAQQLFELTLEPEGGSPLNRPTGPVLFIGRTVRL